MNPYRTLLYLGAALLPVCAGAQAPESPPAAPDPAAAKIVCEEPNFEFGEVENSQTIEHDFILRNDGNTTLEIVKAKPSCGCTVASISNKQIEPGGTATIKAKLNLQGREGKQHKSITVESNDPDTKTLSLLLRGTAIALVSVRPRTIMVPRLISGEAATNRIRIVSREESPLEVTVTTTGNEKVNAKVVPIEDVNGYEVVLTTTDTLPKGTTFGRITVKTNTKSRPVVNVPFRYNVVGEISVYPLELAMVTQVKVLTRTLTLGPGTVQQFTVEQVIVPDASMKATIQEIQASRYRIVVSNITPSLDLNGKFLKIITTAKGMEEVSVPFKIIAKN
jgi:hypothetical protein